VYAVPRIKKLSLHQKVSVSPGCPVAATVIIARNPPLPSKRLAGEFCLKEEIA
jgi:hypothetical protein